MLLQSITDKLKQNLTDQEAAKMTSLFNDNFGDLDSAHLFFSPSRINIIGEHIDYNGGKVLPCAIDIGTYAIIKKREDNLVKLHSANLPFSKTLSLDALDYESNNQWLNYPLGMLKYIQAGGFNIGGFEGVLYGNIPNGSGLSSSASLEMLIGIITSELYNSGHISRVELAKIGMQTENDFIGVKSGIMDQFAIIMGKKNSAIILDTDSLDYSYTPFNLDGYKFVIMNTNKQRQLVDSKYNERKNACEYSLAILKQSFNIKNLADIKEYQLDKVKQKLGDDRLYKRVRHVVTENARVNAMIAAFNAKDIQQIGNLLSASHVSLKSDYDVTGLELDTLKDAAIKFGAAGARMVGAGFGGCAIALVNDDLITDFKKNVGKYYRDIVGYDCEFFVANSADGSHKIF